MPGTLIASQFIFRLTLFFILGIALSSLGLIPWLLTGFSFLAGIFISFFDKRSFLVFSLIGLALGSAYFNYRFDKRNQLNDLWAQEKDLVLAGTVSDIWGPRASGGGFMLRVDWPVSAKSEELKGKIFIFGEHRLSDYNVGDRVLVSGRLVQGDDEYRGWRTKEGIYGSMFHPRVEKTGYNTFYSFKRLLAMIREKSGHLAEQRLPEPQSSLLRAIILGWRPTDSSLNDQLSRTGLEHIAVVSGMQLVILVGLVLSLTQRRQWSSSRSAILALAVILFFTFITGGQPSIYRAGIMSGFGLIGLWLGRPSKPERSIVWAACVLLLANPFLLRWDIGFQLSFLAVVGLIYILPLLRKVFKFWPHSWLKELFLATISAQIMTNPVAIYYFKEVSFIGPLANILVVGLLPLIFTLGLFFFLSFGFPPISFLMGLVLAATTGMISLLAHVSWAAGRFELPLVFLFFYYFGVILILFFNRDRCRQTTLEMPRPKPLQRCHSIDY